MELHSFQKPFLACIVACLLSFVGLIKAQWGPDIRLTYDNGMSVTSYNNAWCIATASNTLHIVWWDDRDGSFDIYYKRSTDNGTTWGEDTPLTNHPGCQWWPAVAVADSCVHVVWRDNRDGNEEIYYRCSYDGGITWFDEQRISNDSGWSDTPSIAATDSLVSIVWWDDRDGGREIYYRQSNDFGMTWGEETRLTNSTPWSFWPCIAIEGSTIHIVWQDCRDGNSETYYKRSIDRGLIWGEDIRLTYASGNSDYPSIGVSDSNVFVVWQDTRDGNEEIYIKHSTNNGSDWSSDDRLTNANDVSTAPTIVISGCNVHVVWWDQRDGQREVYYKKSQDLGVTWQPDTRLTHEIYWSWWPFVAVSGDYVHVIWYDWRFGNHEILYKQDPSGNTGVADFHKLHDQLPYTQLKAIPNPFVVFSKVQGFETEDFFVYDISGRLMGRYKGNRIGIGLASGIYFARCQTGDVSGYLRLVKFE